MKLYYTPGACSLSPHIALREAGLPFDLEQVDLKTKQSKSGGDYKSVNPKGSVPALKLDNGEVLTEAAVVVQYIADKKPDAKLLPPAGSMERYRAQEWLNYISTELHKNLGSFFNPRNPAEWKGVVTEMLGQRFDFLSKKLEGKSYLMGETFSVADGYLFTILNWTKMVNVDLSKWPTLTAYMDRVAKRPAVQAALKAEGLVK